MKFDFVIGNPPYQEETSHEITTNGQKSMKNVFHYFQIEADNISKNSSVLIYPGGRWIHRSGKGMKEFGFSQMNDKRLKKLEFYPNSKDIFGSVAIADGVSIVMKKQSKKEDYFQYLYSHDGMNEKIEAEFLGDELMPLNPKDITITKKIDLFIKGSKLKYLHDSILPRSLFGIESDFVSKNSDKVERYVSNNDIDFSKKIKLFTNDKAGKAGRATWFVCNKDVIKNNIDYIAEWQVVVSSANAGGQKRDNQIEVIDNHSAFGRARVALNSFRTYDEAKHFYDYANTYLVRYAFLMTDEALSTLGLRVPDILDYSSKNSFINFDKNIDEQLIRLIGLTNEEFKYIKNRIDTLR